MKADYFIHLWPQPLRKSTLSQFDDVLINDCNANFKLQKVDAATSPSSSPCVGVTIASKGMINAAFNS